MAFGLFYDANGTEYKGDLVIEPGELAYDVWVGGVQATSTNMRNITGEGITGGTVSYNPATNTVTLNNAHINHVYPYAIDFKTQQDATVCFAGNDNQITGASGVALGIVSEYSSLSVVGATCDYSENTLAIDEKMVGISAVNPNGAVDVRLADGTLLIAADGWAIAASGAVGMRDLTVDNCHVEAVTRNNANLLDHFDNLMLDNCYMAQPVGGYWATSQETGLGYGLVYNADGTQFRGTWVIEPGEPPVTVMPGDVDGNGDVSPADLSVLVDYLLNGGDINEANADVNHSGDVTPSDLSALVDYLLNGSWSTFRANLIYNALFGLPAPDEQPAARRM